VTVFSVIASLEVQVDNLLKFKDMDLSAQVSIGGIEVTAVVAGMHHTGVKRLERA
jgi:hypothetical protein